jgi:hypothetical protein
MAAPRGWRITADAVQQGVLLVELPNGTQRRLTLAELAPSTAVTVSLSTS